MADRLIIDGAVFDIPEEDDWELGELAEFGRLRDRWGDLGSTIALVWLVKHRQDPSFTVEQAERIKVGQVDHRQAEDDADPLPIAGTSTSESGAPSSSSTNGVSVTLEGSGVL